MKCFFLALLMLHLCACSSMQPVSVHDLRGHETPAEIRVGDRVEIITHAGEKFEFTVAEINSLGLVGQFGFISYDQMRRLRVRRPGSSAEDLTWLWAVLGVAAAILLIANLDSVTACSPGPCPSPTPNE